LKTHAPFQIYIFIPALVINANHTFILNRLSAVLTFAEFPHRLFSAAQKKRFPRKYGKNRFFVSLRLFSPCDARLTMQAQQAENAITFIMQYVSGKGADSNRPPIAEVTS